MRLVLNLILVACLLVNLASTWAMRMQMKKLIEQRNDVMHLLQEALEAGDKSRQAARDALAVGERWEGVAGQFEESAKRSQAAARGCLEMRKASR